MVRYIYVMLCSFLYTFSTLFKMIAGLEKPDHGTLTIGDTVKVMYVDQNRMGLQDSRWVAVVSSATP